MSIPTAGAARVEHLVDTYGTTITIYQPTITYNAEGDSDISLGTGTDTKALMFNLAEEEMQFRVEGLDLTSSFRAYFKSDETITKDTIFEYNSVYYKVFSLQEENKGDTTVYYRVILTKSEENY